VTQLERFRLLAAGRIDRPVEPGYRFGSLACGRSQIKLTF
jgi:hypothetical protein